MDCKRLDGFEIDEKVVNIVDFCGDWMISLLLNGVRFLILIYEVYFLGLFKEMMMFVIGVRNMLGISI